MLPSYSLLRVSSEGPKVVSFYEVNQTTHWIFWDNVARDKRNGIIIAYEIKRERVSSQARSKPSIGDNTYSNSTNNFALVTGFQPECNYSISVRAFTSTGGGPFGEKKTLKVSSHYPQRFKIKKSRFSHIVNTQGKRRIVPILEVIDLPNSNTFFDTLLPVSFIYVALTRFSTSLLGSEADHTYRGRTQLDKPITPCN